MSLDDLQLAVLNGKIVVGTKAVKRALTARAVTKVFLASNCPATLRSDMKRYAQLSAVQVEELPQASNEISLICKKNFFVSVVAC